jgi:hypothetical protein
MEQYLQEYTTVSEHPLRVDRRAGIIRDVKLLGLRSRNGRVYRPEALREAVPLYEGAKVNVNHPAGHPAEVRDYRDRLGMIRQVRYEENRGLFGDLVYNPKHSLAEQLAWDAEHLPGNVGLSHNVLARIGKDGPQTVVEAILQVYSVDLVADPATTSGLFEGVSGSAGTFPRQERDPLSTVPRTPTIEDGTSKGYSWECLTVEVLREKRPDLVEAICRPARHAQEAAEAQLQQLRQELGKAERTILILRTLAEFGLPLPGSSGWDDRLLGGAFLESLYAAGDEATVRRLVGERAEFLAQQLPSGLVRTPRSRIGFGYRSAQQELQEFLEAIRVES